MQYNINQIEAFPALSPKDQEAFIAKLGSPDYDDLAIKAFLIAATHSKATSLIARALSTNFVRSCFSSIAPEMLRAAYHEGYLEEIKMIIPDDLSDEEGGACLEFPCSIKYWPMAEIIFELNSRPTKQLFIDIFDGFSLCNDPEFDIKFLVKSVNIDGFGWREFLSFQPKSDYYDVLKRASVSRNQAFYVVAFAIMSIDEKISYISKIDSLEKLDLVMATMVMPENWMSFLDMDIKAKLLSNSIGI